MSSYEEVRQERIKKREALKKRGIDPYPADTSRTHCIADVETQFETLVESEKQVGIAGRIMSLRRHGGSTFADLFDGTARMQIFLSKDDLADAYDLFTDTVDQGDFVEVTGTVFVTKTGAHTIKVSSWQMLTKALQGVPSEWFGIKDEEARYRKRYLDLLLNEELRDLFYKKAEFWKVMRAFLEERDFLAVETPTLELTTGGAEATPFKTHHNDFDLDLYLRISVGELWQKRLMAAGFPRTYEIGRVYRNEGSSAEHLQEFTNMEFYAAYVNFEEGKQLVKELYQTLAERVFGTTTFTYKDHTFNLADEWKEIDYVQTIKEMTGVDVLSASESELKNALEKLQVKYEGDNRERMTDSLWKFCRKQIAGPAFLVNHPKTVAPLSKEHSDNPSLTQTLQVIVAGTEVGRAHAELNDPEDQQKRFDEQRQLLEAGDTEAMMSDDEYVEMLEYGIPPTFGFGMGERFFSMLAGEPIRETQLFPLMRPKDGTE